MSPLQTFLRLAGALAHRPFAFWPTESQQDLMKEMETGLEQLKAALTMRCLEKGLAFSQLASLSASMQDRQIQEVPCIQGVRAVLSMYRLTTLPLPPETAALLDEASKAAAKAEQTVLEYHLAIDSLNAKATCMSSEEQKAHDLRVLHEMGMFYVLEYTLQLLYECDQRPEQEQHALVFQGLKVPVGNLPALIAAEPTLKHELCYNIIDHVLRNELLTLFFRLEDSLETKDLVQIRSALCAFNISLATILQKNGIENFQARLLPSYGNRLSMAELLVKLQNTQENTPSSPTS